MTPPSTEESCSSYSNPKSHHSSIMSAPSSPKEIDAFKACSPLNHDTAPPPDPISDIEMAVNIDEVCQELLVQSQSSADIISSDDEDDMPLTNLCQNAHQKWRISKGKFKPVDGPPGSLLYKVAQLVSEVKESIVVTTSKIDFMKGALAKSDAGLCNVLNSARRFTRS